MPTYRCRYATPAGTIETEQRDAESAAGLRRELEARGFLVLEVAPAARFRLRRLALARRVSRADLLVLSQELHALVRAGLPVASGLELLERRAEHPTLRATLAAVRADVVGGAPLSEAAARHPRVFPPLHVAALRAGERSGALADCLAGYLALLKRTLALRKQVIGALIYPGILLALSLGVVAFLLAYVVPTFARVYADLRAALPAPTRLLVEATRAGAALAPSVGLLGGIGAVVAARRLRTPAGRRRLDAALLRLPLVGEVLRHYAAALFCRTFATVLAGGIPVVAALEVAADAAGNAEIRARLVAQAPAVAGGTSLAAALEQARALPATAVEMLAVGEQTGSLPEMLGHVADFFDEAIDTRLARLTAVLEPALMVTMGLVVGTIVVVMYLPIFDLSSAVR